MQKRQKRIKNIKSIHLHLDGFPLEWKAERVLKKIVALLDEQRCFTLPNGILLLNAMGVSHQKMRAMNLKYRGKNQVTDVLSFEQPLEPTPTHPPFLFLGDLVFCVSQVEKQAKEHGHSARREFLILAIHGVLHLLGFDHERSMSDLRKMQSLEGKLLKLVILRKNSKRFPGLLERSQLKK